MRLDHLFDVSNQTVAGGYRQNSNFVWWSAFNHRNVRSSVYDFAISKFFAAPTKIFRRKE